METIGLIGVGKIGTEIAKHLLSRGYRVLGYRRSSLAQFESIGGVAARSPADVGEESDIVLSCLPGGDSLDQVVAGTSGLIHSARNGQVVVELGSHPLSARSGRSRGSPPRERSSSTAKWAVQRVWSRSAGRLSPAMPKHAGGPNRSCGP